MKKGLLALAMVLLVVPAFAATVTVSSIPAADPGPGVFWKYYFINISFRGSNIWICKFSIVFIQLFLSNFIRVCSFFHLTPIKNINSTFTTHNCNLCIRICKVKV